MYFQQFVELSAPCFLINMKKIYAITLLVFSIMICRAQTIPNAGFENWTNFGTYSDPDSWSSQNFITASSSMFTCEQDSPGAVGASFMKLTTKLISGSTTVGFAQSKATFFQQGAGFAYNLTPVNFTGQYQYIPGTGDAGFGFVLFTRWNSGLMTRDTVANAVQVFSAATTGWTVFSAPINYLLSGNPDSATIIFESSGFGTTTVGTMLYLDDLGFSGNITTGINASSPAYFTIAPNPFSSETTLSFSQEQNNSTIYITDVLGKEIRKETFSGKQFMIEKENMNSGIYFVQITDEKKNIVNRKIVVE